MKQSRKRSYDTVMRHRLEAKGAVLVEGPKWCGKTTTCLQLAQSVLYMAQPDIREQNIMLTDMQRSEEHTSELQSPSVTLFPYTTLFRSNGAGKQRLVCN